ncbi:Hypothetical protein NCS54_01188400 [Fusarium falciforme]|uniref:Hypothetical protein n=1 Tax=Fusarium falciforme TaxID=195108 RepID=UPI0023012507|nr:Hypothetical protein NCS54_01188400 [Fusarium falciforme]WAO94306.1 Hypothetical protein NCS54_01188400 [Fusarium falciforme]
MNEVGRRNFGSGKGRGPLSLHEVMGYRAKLLEWMQSLPASLSPGQIALPRHLKLHMHVYNLMMNLFEPSVGSDYGRNILSPSPEEIVISSRACMESVVRLYYTRHSFEHLDTIMVTYLLFVGFNALKMLGMANPQDHDAALSTAVLCAKGLCDQSRFYYIAEAIFMVLRDSMDPNAAHLLKDFAHTEDEEERK